jgi:hypothetical protein
MGIKDIFEKLTGIDKIKAQAKLEADAAEQARLESLARAAEARAAEEAAKQAEEIARMSPKERATAKGEPWVAVLDTHVNAENPRNGFFELDWNAQFVLQLKQAGYGFDGDPDEEIVDRWFRDLARTMLAEDGQDTTRGAGFINVVPITKNKSEVS